MRNFTANVIGEDKAFMFGGFTSDSLGTDNAYVFDMATYKIQSVATKGSKPSARGGHVTLVLFSNHA